MTKNTDAFRVVEILKAITGQDSLAVNRKFRDEIEQLWHQKANEKLNTTVNDYLRGLSITIRARGTQD